MKKIDIEDDDWTKAKNGRTNSSKQFLFLVSEVESIIRGGAHSLINGQVNQVARVIMAQLAHRHGLRPAPQEKRR